MPNEWHLTSERPPVMLDFATAEDIEDNNQPHVNGLWAEVEVSYRDTPGITVLKAAVRIDFTNNVKWECLRDSDKTISVPKWWRKKK